MYQLPVHIWSKRDHHYGNSAMPSVSTTINVASGTFLVTNDFGYCFWWNIESSWLNEEFIYIVNRSLSLCKQWDVTLLEFWILHICTLCSILTESYLTDIHKSSLRSLLQFMCTGFVFMPSTLISKSQLDTPTTIYKYWHRDRRCWP